MNRAHRLADQVRSVVGWLNRVPTESQFLTKGFLTPAEFVEAGDQLVFQCPSWQWQTCHSRRRQVFWLPPNKQFLLTRNIPCRHRVTEWDESFCRQSHVTAEGWLVPGPQPGKVAVVSRRTNSPALIHPSTVRTLDGQEVDVHHEGESDEEEEEEDEESDSRTRPQNASADNQQAASEFVDVDECNADVDDFQVIGDNDDDQVGTQANRTQNKQTEVNETDQPVASSRRKRGLTVPTRSYDLSITYDKYYQSPRLWLFGYDESGVPLRADAVFQDIHSDYLSKTVTVDPHPFTGVPTVSVHPCKHASVMRNVAQSWLRSGILPRHDLALFVLLKMVASVVPTINYDFTIDVEMPIGVVPDDDEDAANPDAPMPTPPPPRTF